MALVLGINAYHGDSSAAILRDGEIIAAVEEERFRRIKHWAGLPTLSMQYCLTEAGLKFSDLEHIAINLDPRLHHGRRLLHLLRHWPSPKLILARLGKLGKTQNVEGAIRDAFTHEGPMRARVHYIEHHLAHLASSYYCSPFQEAANLSVDGMGNFASAAWGYGKGAELSVTDRVFFPHSLGIFYSALTQWLGFPHYGDEYKVMGLAPYGVPNHLDEMGKIVCIQADGSFKLDLKYFRHHREAVPYTWDNGSPEVGMLYSAELEQLLGPARRKDEPLTQRHRDIARSVQAMYEEAFFALLSMLHRKHPSNNLTLSGGCGMNSVANGKVALRSPFKNVYIQSAAGDAGGAIGAALVANYNLDKPASNHAPMPHAYLGPQYGRDEIGALLDSYAEKIQSENCIIKEIADADELCRLTAQAISEGKVIGWFQGRLEWGPRALGNRSILGDPRRADMKEILNAKIKRRESFRPFAPSVLREDVADWFEQDADVPFMMQVFQIREEKRSLIPAVCHVDGSGRLQTVNKEVGLYHRLISHFKKITGVPMVLNTSFNENEPVVCQPKEALECFLRTKMDVLVMGEYLVKRNA